MFFRKNNDKRNNKDILYRYNNMGTSRIDTDRKYWCDNNYDLRLSKNDPETLIEDLIICNMLGIL